MHAYHDHALAAHLGFPKTLEKLQRKYYWPRLHDDLREHCASCRLCGEGKSPRRRPLIPLRSTGRIWYPFQRMSVDHVKLLESDRGNTYLLVFTDYLTRWTEAFPVKSTDAKTVAEKMYEHIICRYGVPEELLSDNHKAFTGEVIKELTTILKISKTFITPYHPQANGLTERVNSTLQNMLAMFLNEHQRDWDLYLAPVLFALNTSHSSATGYSPYFLMYGRDPRLPIDILLNTPVTPYASMSEYAQALVRRLQAAFAHASEELHQSHLAAQRMDRQRSKNMLTFKEGDRVWLFIPVIPRGHTTKVARRWHGPYRVVQKLGDVSYKVRPADGTSRQPVKAHVSRLKPYHDRRNLNYPIHSP